MKKGSLELSVNAIVIFVLAFAMLGVGLYIVNIVRETVAPEIYGAPNLNQLKNPPSTETPITIPQDVTLKKGKEAKLEIAYYNKESRVANDAKIGISNCISPDNVEIAFDKAVGSEDTNPVMVISPRGDIGSSEAGLYKIKLVDNSKKTDEKYKLTTGAYTCTLIAYNGGDSAYEDGWGDFPQGEENNPYEKVQFWLNVVS